MDKITQILSTKKTAGATQKALNLPFNAESEQSGIVEYNVFRRINQLDQFYTDKRNCTSYRFYGHINEVVNLNLGAISAIRPPEYTGYELRMLSTNFSGEIYLTINGNAQLFSIIPSTSNNDSLYEMFLIAFNIELSAGDFTITNLGTYLRVDPAAKEVDMSGSNYPLEVTPRVYTGTQTYSSALPTFNDFDFTVSDNWRMYLTAPLQFTTGTTENKGDYECSTTYTYDGIKRTFNFRMGLPALPIKSQPINNKVRSGILLYLGHNLKPDDLFYLTNVDDQTISGTYRVVDVIGNKVYYQLVALNFKDVYAVAATGNTFILAPAVESVKVGVDEIELGISTSYYQELTGRTDVNWLAVIEPHIFVKKLVDRTPSEYYLKKLYALDEFNDVINCGYANNSYNQKTFLYTQANKSKFTQHKTALLAPVTDVYQTFVKNVKPSMNMTSIQANFYNFIGCTFENEGIQTVNSGGDSGNLMNTQKFLYHSLVEYNPETLTEVEINHIEHTFLCNIKDIPVNRVRFGYNPFHWTPILKFSNNIEEVDAYLGAPEHAVYSEKYQTYRWRHLLEIGYFEAQGNGIDFPYLNDAFYVYGNIFLNIKNFSSSKVSSILTGGYLLSAYVDTLTQTDPTNTNTTGNDQLDESLLDKNKNDKPFEQFNGAVC